MFEREFEFTVHHPIEVCEQRIVDMGTPGCVPSFIYPISSNVNSHKGYSEFYLRRHGRGAKNQITAVIEKIDESTSSISGIATPQRFWESIIFYFAFMELFWTMMAITSDDWFVMLPGTGIAIFIVGLYVLQAVQERNELIDRLQRTLNQPKKK